MKISSSVIRALWRWGRSYCAPNGIEIQVLGAGGATTTVDGEAPIPLGHQAHLEGIDRCLRPITHIELAQDIAHIVLDRLLRQPQLLGDLPIAVSLHNGIEDVPLSAGQPRLLVAQP